MMGQYDNEIIDKHMNERDCPSCETTRVMVDWANSPNVTCDECGFSGDVIQCMNCENLLIKPTEHYLCSDCRDR